MLKENRKYHLDFTRGCAALAVCAGHLRAFQFITFPEVSHASAADKVFYLITGFGQQAVIVFFVLSGYLIAGSVADSVDRAKWSWRGYALRRLTRLWLVLLPALLLTALFDSLGGHLAGGYGYDGRFAEVMHSGPTAQHPISGGVLTFLGNMFFLQTAVSPVFGSNSPLWSLANEFWYYVLFPLIYLVFRGQSGIVRRVAFGALAAGIAFWLPPGMVAAFGIWLLGFAVYLALKRPILHSVAASPVFFCVALILFLMGLCQTRTGGPLGADYVIGCAFAGMMPFIIVRQPANRAYRWVAAWLSEISYTLYVVHFPLFAFVFFVFRLPAKSEPGFLAYTAFGGLLILALCYAVSLWWCFESRTDPVRKWVEACFPGQFRARGKA